MVTKEYISLHSMSLPVEISVVVVVITLPVFMLSF